MPTRWTVSVVSHGHGATTARVLTDVHRHLGDVAHELVLTFNAGEDERFVADLPASLRARLRVIRNTQARGFGANHNAALRDADAEFVLMADPDLAIPQPVFETIEHALRRPDCGVVAPLAMSPSGLPEDNGRAVVTPLQLLRRQIVGRKAECQPPGGGAIEVDWLAGLFLALRAETFAQLGGFDEAYHLYCEDVDLCLRARAAGLKVLLLRDTLVIHPARRRTLKSLRHLRWHIASLLRLWRSPAYRALR